MARPALYSGTWYPSDKKELEKYFEAGAKKQEAKAAVCPHAGWLYSGKTAGKVFSELKPSPLYIVIGPNHRGRGAPVSVYPGGSWQTPAGDLDIDEEAAASIADLSKYAKLDDTAHIQEHSLEVQAPFIKLTSPSAKIVPICMYDYSPETCKDLGLAIAKVALGKQVNKNLLIIASTDMSHYVAASRRKRQNGLAIDKILSLDPEGLLSTVEENGISMCGAGPVAAALWAAKELGASKGRLVNYSTSGDVTGDNREVVGYAGIIIT